MSQRILESLARSLALLGVIVPILGCSNAMVGSDIISAANHDDIRRVRELLKDGANVNARDPELNCTALHFAANYDDLQLVELLLENGADVNARDNQGYTPLMDASINDRYYNVCLLIRHGAGVNATCSYGTPLYMAARIGSMPIVAELLERGADPTIRINGHTASECAYTEHHYAVAGLLARAIRRAQPALRPPQVSKQAVGNHAS